LVEPCSLRAFWSLSWGKWLKSNQFLHVSDRLRESAAFE
jgi:hypothetical protein